MKYTWVSAFAGILLITLAGSTIAGPAFTKKDKAFADQKGSYASGRIIVKLKSALLQDKPQYQKSKAHVSASVIEAASDKKAEEFFKKRARNIHRKFKNNLYVVSAVAGSEKATIEELKKDPMVAFAELDRLVRPAFTPNDPQLSGTWYPAKLNLFSGWDVDASSVTIAILDTGVDPNHIDIAASLLQGWNIPSNSTDASDVNGHGTGTAGVAAAVTNNGAGIAGIARNAKILPVRITNFADGSAYMSNIIDGVYWAADHGAKVINISYSQVPESLSIIDAAYYARTKGVLTVIAAGNDNRILSSVGNSPITLVVSGSDRNDQRSYFSNYGDAIDLAAPAEGIIVPTPGNGWVGTSGTSFASPMVAGEAAILFAKNPNLSLLDVEKIIKSSAFRPTSNVPDVNFGYGRIDVGAAVAMANSYVPVVDTSVPTVSITSPAEGQVFGEELVNVTAAAADDVRVIKAELLVNGQTATYPLYQEPFTFSWNSGFPQDMTQAALSVRVYDDAGNATVSQPVNVKINHPETHTLTINAQATLADLGTAVSTRIKLGNVLDQTALIRDHATDLTYTLPAISAGDELSIALLNAEAPDGQSRSLIINSVTLDGVQIPVDLAHYDLGDGDAAYDGQNVTGTTGHMNWNGALRFTLSKVQATARGDLAEGVGPLMQFFVNGRNLATSAVDNVQAKAFTYWTANLPANSEIAFVFPNDYYANGQDRNLYIDGVSLNNTDLSIASAIYDRGTGAQAFDNLDILPSTGTLLSAGALRFLNLNGSAPSGDTIVIDDAVPSGASLGTTGGEEWNWQGQQAGTPAPHSGTLLHASDIIPGIHQHYYWNAEHPIAVHSGDTLFAYVYLDPAHMPREVMLQWSDGPNWYRAYWGEDYIPWSGPGDAYHHYMGPLPAAGQWVRLEVPASLVNMEGNTFTGLAFSLVDGRAFWDEAGTSSAGSQGYNIEFRGLNHAGGDQSVFIDNVNIVGAPGAVHNASFESPNVGGGYQYNPSDDAWLFSSGSGVQANGSDWAGPDTNSGTQALFLQGTGYASQRVTLPPGTYRISFDAVQRSGGNYYGNVQNQDIEVYFNGTSVYHLQPPPGGWASYNTATFTVP